ncbi:helix-turn-helix domain-containing protein [Brevibacillus sp. HD3.3A]|uniref:helix-turn-helix domain-containing protein n=1 Tax=Brevibacillus sp. HD3.3A TaxID=2738979 RepID=UPI00156B61A8|nr:helix-turn-helix domain-containing protein [Brevibacillus sp. HD3.3A]UED67407.1 helix-turn-helix domain-containing protein [Brevibacillus sp. HD3.3A]UED67589.1 helix-turn-helix domain-containing protein [Brevibacillus sp. HD3.3A]UED68961.1 helix-turn-helix domain-containing protein [Brevibacillus sp. HD3.3A]UED69227.1 helix-turn-helix domain-containing protein [Brevibacillus sp. HD3.3A]UED69567.1 helix-turn-helix domain-containing protein [Brevibacillus sp. HD3.3A]
MGKMTYSLEFKTQVVEWFEQGATYKQIQETYGLDLRMFRRWVRKYRDHGVQGLVDQRGKAGGMSMGRPRKNPMASDERIRRLEAEVEFLKKLLEARKGERRRIREKQ